MRPNPCNSTTLYGTINSAIQSLSRSDGTEYAIAFKIAVKRNYQDDEGLYPVDLIPMRYEIRNNEREFAASLAEGDGIIVSGSICQDNERILVQADSITLDEETRRAKYHLKGNEVVSADFILNLPLPY